MSFQVLQGDAIAVLRTLAAESVNCCVTSPPYWGLRDYSVDGQIGLEKTPEEYIAKLVEVFRRVREVLRKDGTLWVVIADSYANDGKWGGETGGMQAYLGDNDRKRVGREKRVTGLKPKDLIGIPWRLAFVLQADGWYLRSDIIWAKPNPMPESVTDRPTKSHEYIFLLSKAERYYYDAAAIAELAIHAGQTITMGEKSLSHAQANGANIKASGNGKADSMIVATMRNKRSVWTIPTKAYSEAHFATFPTALIEPCILAGCPEGGTVLDPFSGSGTTGIVATRHGRNYIGIELNDEYIAMSYARWEQDAPLKNISPVESTATITGPLFD